MYNTDKGHAMRQCLLCNYIVYKNTVLLIWRYATKGLVIKLNILKPSGVDLFMGGLRVFALFYPGAGQSLTYRENQ